MQELQAMVIERATKGRTDQGTGIKTLFYN